MSVATAANWGLGRQRESLQGGWAGRLAGWMRVLVKARAGAEAPLRVEARISLGPKKSLVLVNCQGRQVLLAVSGDGITPVMELAAARRPRKARP